MRDLDGSAWLEGLTVNPYIERVSLDWPPEKPYHLVVVDREGDITHDRLKNLDMLDSEDDHDA